ncbi:MAG: hypothetical protein JEY99_13900 [Spirochaetales bacterium]|nr:hypothetical protein [Spirochaetales bacterium]
MSGIIPDWEWRTFGKEIPLKVDLNIWQRTIRIESSDIYIISTIAEDCFRIQEGILIIDRLHQVNADGLEQWLPESKFEFPINIEEIKSVYKLFRLSMPSLTEKEYKKEEFIQIVKRNSRLILSKIDKVIHIYDIRDCIVEKADLRIDGESIVSIAVKDPDAQLIKKTLIHLGIEGRENKSYTSAIKLSQSNLLS